MRQIHLRIFKPTNPTNNIVKTHPKTLITALAALTFGWAFQTQAEDKKSSLNAADTNFVKMVGEDGHGEVKIATLATGKAERADVKEFATMLVTEHTKANEELAALAKAKNVDISAVLAADAASDFKDLEKESGAEFDKAFLKHMEKDHKKDITAFEDAEKDAADAELKAWAGKMLPTLRMHLQKVKDLMGK